MTDQHKLFGAYDIRGIYGKGLDEPFAKNVGLAYGHYLKPQGGGRVLVGCDARTSSPALKEAFVEGILNSGNDVLDIGISSTPMAVWYAAQAGFHGGAVVTASHMGKQYNGLKLYAGQAKPLGANNGLGEIRTKVEIGGSGQSTNTKGKLSTVDIIPEYVSFLLRHVRPERRLKIALDAGHGAAGPELEELARTAKHLIDFILLNSTPDGTFPNRTPNPLDEGSLTELSKTVVEQKCDFGVSFDGDADRAVFVDEHGVQVDTGLMIGLIGAELVRRHGGGKVVYDLRASRAVPEYIVSQGGTAIRTGVGTQFMMNSMKDHRALFAGELSGHYYFADMYATDNALRTMLEAVNVVARGTASLSKLIEPLMVYSSSGEINLRVSDIQETLGKLESSIAGGTKEHIDGLSVNFDDWWFSARGSQTEPVLRLTIGAVTKEILAERKAQLFEIIEG
ncbi:phosphomannomutase/phosphoglucomutase [soil metagenome]